MEESDFVIMKRDGYPTYHFANVVDDYNMKITGFNLNLIFLKFHPQMLFEDLNGFRPLQNIWKFTSNFDYLTKNFDHF